MTWTKEENAVSIKLRDSPFPLSEKNTSLVHTNDYPYFYFYFYF